MSKHLLILWVCSVLLVTAGTRRDDIEHEDDEETAAEKRTLQLDKFARGLLTIANKISGVCPPVNNISDKRSCWLRYSQMSFAGTHNSGAQSDMKLKFMGLPAPDCTHANQKLNIKEQLTIGVRSFDFDVARSPTNSSEVQLVHCSGVCAYGGPLKAALLDIKQFLSDNKNQIILIRIKNHDVEDSTERVLLTQAILELIEATLGKRLLNYHTDPLIASVLILKRPVFFYIHTEMWRSIKLVPQQLRYLALYLRPVKTLETWYATSDEVNLQCELKEDAIEYLDEHNSTMTKYPWIPIVSDWYKSNLFQLNVCLDSGAETCEETLGQNVKIARYLQNKYNRTINVLMTDFTGIETVKLVKNLNKLNMKHFVTKKQGFQLMAVSHSLQTTKYPFVPRSRAKRTEKSRGRGKKRGLEAEGSN